MAHVSQPSTSGGLTSGVVDSVPSASSVSSRSLSVQQRVRPRRSTDSRGNLDVVTLAWEGRFTENNISMGPRRKSGHEDDDDQSSARSSSNEKIADPRTGDGDEQEEAVSTNDDRQKEDAGVDELAKGLDGVSLEPKLSVDQITAPKELRQVADMIKSGKFDKILILTGAGVSVSAGIPDFRTPGTGRCETPSFC